MMMKSCIVQTNEYNLQATMYPIISTHTRPYSHDGNGFLDFQAIYETTDRTWRYNRLRYTTTGLLILGEDENEMS